MRRIKKAAIKFISLVPAGANKVDAVYKADGSFSFSPLVKASDNFDEEGELLAVVYAPNMRDSQGDIADASVVKQMAHDFIANGAGIDINHDGKPVGKDRARVAETFLVRKTDDRFHGWKDRDGNQVDLTGAWAAVIKIDDPELRKKYRSGEWAGVSMGGTALVEAEKTAGSSLDRLVDALKAFAAPQQATQTATSKSTDMTPQELQTVISESNKTLLAGVAELIKSIAPKAENKDVAKSTDDIPDHVLANPRLFKMHMRKLDVKALKESTIAVGDPAGFRTGYAELQKAWAEEDAADKATSAGPSKDTVPAEVAKGVATVAELGGVKLEKRDALEATAGALMAQALQAKA